MSKIEPKKARKSHQKDIKCPYSGNKYSDLCIKQYSSINPIIIQKNYVKLIWSQGKKIDDKIIRP